MDKRLAYEIRENLQTDNLWATLYKTVMIPGEMKDISGKTKLQLSQVEVLAQNNL